MPSLYQIIDVTDEAIMTHADGGNETRRLMETIAMVHPDDFPLTRLLNTAHSLPSTELADYRRIWIKLRSENSAFRVVGTFGIKSVPIDSYDSLLLSCTERKWLKCAMIVARVAVRTQEEGYHNGDDLVLFGRLRALAKSGAIESSGSMLDMRSSEVRLKQS
jgi:hypothetical protein